MCVNPNVGSYAPLLTMRVNFNVGSYAPLLTMRVPGVTHSMSSFYQKKVVSQAYIQSMQYRAAPVKYSSLCSTWCRQCCGLRVHSLLHFLSLNVKARLYLNQTFSL